MAPESLFFSTSRAISLGWDVTDAGMLPVSRLSPSMLGQPNVQ
jgi:hypothetical protein